ncbi:Panacea domain-containing protein [Dickeya dianthicola]|uniref:Panacea domain-containing protein n=1 Tax=Dickeya dianthicola TaxID=204039 RepID=UPI001866C978|nr:type II toxin-antitoxin system antitoxin SocA domain-containing protein [Dickeya dianthicola]QOL12904.1 SocA family protein [Dickeya dianthicola]
MAYSAISVANSLIKKAKERGIKDLTPMKLQKLVYFAHAWMLAIDERPLINETVKAWKFGPVIDSVYHEFKTYGAKNIDSFGTEFDLIDIDDNIGVPDVGFITPYVDRSDTKAHSVMDAILDTYGDKSATFLSNLTHASDSAWSITRKEHNDGSQRGFVIDDEIIKAAMKRKLGL